MAHVRRRDNDSCTVPLRSIEALLAVWARSNSMCIRCNDADNYASAIVATASTFAVLGMFCLFAAFVTSDMITLSSITTRLIRLTTISRRTSSVSSRHGSRPPDPVVRNVSVGATLRRRLSSVANLTLSLRHYDPSSSRASLSSVWSSSDEQNSPVADFSQRTLADVADVKFRKYSPKIKVIRNACTSNCIVTQDSPQQPASALADHHFSDASDLHAFGDV